MVRVAEGGVARPFARGSRGRPATRVGRLRAGAVAAWLGLIALGLNALVPIHLAFDLAHAFAPEQHEDGVDGDHDLVRCLLSLLTGHHEHTADHSSDKSGHHEACAVYGAIGTLASFAPAAVVLLAVPISVAALSLRAIKAGALHPASTAAYRSRAPPIA
jgi:hypothetical protein